MRRYRRTGVANSKCLFDSAVFASRRSVSVSVSVSPDICHINNFTYSKLKNYILACIESNNLLLKAKQFGHIGCVM
jgi:hypothetical protein